ncbi:MAG: aminotransferase class I/II-fold pyridoxal phosphate-dependent enzyme [Alkalispirochaeta sp.]
MQDDMPPGVVCGHFGEEEFQYHGAAVPPLFQTSLFTGEHWGYSRFANPSVTVVERKIAALEHTEAALCFASGMAAISASVLSCVTAGDHVVALRSLYGGTRRLLETFLPRYGVTTTFVRGETLSEFQQALRPETRLIILESPTTFTFRTPDIAAIAALARQEEIVTLLDNSWATPIFQRPADHGIDIVCHSASKYLAGHSDVIAGVVATSASRAAAMQGVERGLIGGSLDPFAAWLLTRGLRTLPIRMRAHEASAVQIARKLADDPRVVEVLHPALAEDRSTTLSGSSGLFAVRLDLARVDIPAFLKRLTVFQAGPSWGGFESLVVHPASIHDAEWLARSDIPPDLVRFSVGLEEAEFLLDDIQTALEAGKE